MVARNKSEQAAPEVLVPEAMEFGVTGWRPAAGDEIRLTVTNLTIGTSEWGSYPIVEGVDYATGQTVALHAFHEVLQGDLIRIQPEIGHELYVKYWGRTAGSGNSKGAEDGYHAYSVTSPQYVFNWGAFGRTPPPKVVPENNGAGTAVVKS